MKIVPDPISTPDEVFERFLQLHKESLDPEHGRTWIYRGQKCSKTDGGFSRLKTSLAWALSECGHSLEKAPQIEMGLLRKFKRQSGDFLTQIPEQGNYMEWFSLMQHHGTPTRLLDWSYSFFVGLFFAIAELGPEEDGELWVVDAKHFAKHIRRLFPRKSDRRCAGDDPNAQVHRNFERMFMCATPKQFICSMNPYRFNTRLIIQQGLFLCPGDITRSFGKNLESHFATQQKLDSHLKVLEIKRKFREDLMQVLYRMNIGEASLFPGMDGFAKSFKDALVFPNPEVMFPPDSPYVKRTWSQGRQ